VPKVGFEPTRGCPHYALNVARLPFRHFGEWCSLPKGMILCPPGFVKCLEGGLESGKSA
jgi:hypothetical protein